MGLSRNKVAVSEGAAGSPPFYGEPLKTKESDGKRFVKSREPKNKVLTRKEIEYGLLFNFEGPHLR